MNLVLIGVTDCVGTATVCVVGHQSTIELWPGKNMSLMGVIIYHQKLVDGGVDFISVLPCLIDSTAIILTV